MKRANFYLSEKQIDALKEQSAETGLSASEILRRVIDDWNVRIGQAVIVHKTIEDNKDKEIKSRPTS
jgi:hypothetical protein